MSRLRDLSIQRKLMVIIMLTTVLALVLASVAFYQYDRVTFRDKLVRDIDALSATLEVPTTDALVYNDKERARQILGGLAVQPRIVSAAIFDADGEPFAGYSRSGIPDTPPRALALDGHAFGAHSLALQRAMRFGDRRVGSFYVKSDLSELHQRRGDYLKILAAVIGGVSLLAFFFSSILQRVVSKPILALAGVARAVSEKKDYTVRAAVPRGKDEVGRLVDGFNDMLAQIEARDEELRVARDKAELANRSKSVFLANMSHELRTPLTAIIGYSEILEDDAEEMGLEDFLPDLRKIKAAGKHLLGLINSILDLSKVESGKMELYVESFDLKELISEVASTVVPLMEKNGNALTIDAADGLGSVKGDLTKTRQILFNLLSNASKFTERGRVRLEATRHRGTGSDQLRFVVSDSGIGMSPEQLSRLFKPFSQADASTARNYGGTGLGLALCKRFCQVMGGRIEVDSELGRGTTFTVTLPADMDPNARTPSSVHQLIESGEWNARQLAKAKPGDARLVLVIDDDAAVHDLLRDLLEKEGFKVASAANGKEGLKLAYQLRPAIITLDVYMPDSDGWTVLTTLKADPQLADIPVIMISISDQRQRGYAMGAEYLTKPIDRKKLIALLDRYRRGGATPEVLVVDDDAGLRAMLRKLLEEQGCKVAEAENGLAALRRLNESQPSLILLDLIMPQLDGFGFMAQMRKNPAFKSTPVVVLTAMDIGPQEIERLNGGVERILQKSAYDLDELKAEIRSLARGSLHV
jgi:signal transduction histidine kinase/CheY-like chemotaxis protein